MIRNKRKSRDSRVFSSKKKSGPKKMNLEIPKNEKEFIVVFSKEIKKVRSEFFGHEIEKYKNLKLTIVE